MVMKQLSYSGLIIALLSIISLSIVPHCVMATNQTDNVNSRTVTGTARIITSSSQLSTVCRGDIVVAHMTDVSWESALCLAAGIITDKGDSSSHAVLFGKRMSIPVIVGAGNATKIISDGQTVTIDCLQNSFYTERAAISDVTVSHYRMTPKSVPHSAPSGYSTTSSHSSVSTVQSSGQRAGVGCQRVSPFNITKENLRQEQPEIVKYMHYISGLISLGSKTPKWAAYMWEGIEEDVYDSMPVRFFKCFSTRSKIYEGLNQCDFDDNDLHYMHEGIEQISAHREKPVHPNILGRILYRRMVDKLSIPENYKQILKRTPIKMDEFIKQNIVKVEEYMHFNKLNLTTQYYLKKHGIIK